ncbi:hypothetical protein HA51_26385 [Pantoea rwandensis]|uniref:Uncharacterized protein n=1 Tax=Pantoea rwandensis TaxID=1076550 RepID=A0A1X1CK17_9GAMM|nr:hypothetical protein HA51_26385 [Pantoea rwandensis]
MDAAYEATGMYSRRLYVTPAFVDWKARDRFYRPQRTLKFQQMCLFIHHQFRGFRCGARSSDQQRPARSQRNLASMQIGRAIPVADALLFGLVFVGPLRFSWL